MRRGQLSGIDRGYVAVAVNKRANIEHVLDECGGLFECFVDRIAVQNAGTNAVAAIRSFAVERELVRRAYRSRRRQTRADHLTAARKTRKIVKIRAADRDHQVVFEQRSIQSDGNTGGGARFDDLHQISRFMVECF